MHRRSISNKPESVKVRSYRALAWLRGRSSGSCQKEGQAGCKTSPHLRTAHHSSPGPPFRPEFPLQLRFNLKFAAARVSARSATTTAASVCFFSLPPFSVHGFTAAFEHVSGSVQCGWEEEEGAVNSTAMLL